MSSSKERGFTVIELVIAIVVIALLLGTSLLFLRPADYSAIEQNAKRRTDVARIVQAINRYVADKGELPPNIPTTLAAISSTSGHYNLCSYVVPKYLKDVPLDPLLGLKTKNNNSQLTTDRCDEPGVDYAAGYAIQKNKQGRVVVSAPVAGKGVVEIMVSQP